MRQRCKGCAKVLDPHEDAETGPARTLCRPCSREAPNSQRAMPTVAFRIDVHDRRRVERAAEVADVTVSEFIRRAVTEAARSLLPPRETE